VPNSLERRHNRRRRHERTRQELIQAALDRASNGSFKDLTVESITREAGVSRSAFYVYFGDKEELLLGALEDLIASHQNRLGNCWPTGGDPRRGIEKAIYDISRVYADNSELLALAHETATYDDEVRELWSALLETITEGTAEQIRTRQREGSIASTLDAEALANGLVLMTERSLQVNLGQDQRGTESVAAEITKVWWAALFQHAPAPVPRSAEAAETPDPGESNDA
jgi:TetR/AcrR family transcriptional regulator, ethionamide resistance regulator